MMIWREKRTLLAVLAVLLAANAVFFLTYRVQYESRLKDLDERKQRSEAQVIQARSRRLTAERRVAVYRKTQRDVQAIYDEHWSTEQERLTAMMAEVRKLAIDSKLEPARTISYSRTPVKRVLKDATPTEEVVITFTVSGGYQQVRRMINLLELSPQFVIIDQIGLSSPDTQNLTLTLRLKTLFRDTAPPVAKQM